MKAPKKLTPLSILTGILLAGTFVMPSCASLENASAAMSCGHEGKVPVSSKEMSKLFWYKNSHLLYCGVSCSIKMNGKIDFEIDPDLIKKGMPKRVGKNITVKEVSLAHTGPGCLDGNSHQTQGNGFLLYALALDVSWTEVTYRCSDPSCTVAQVEIDPLSVTSATGYLIKERRSCKSLSPSN